LVALARQGLESALTHAGHVKCVYNAITGWAKKGAVMEHLILGAFLIVPLLIVAFLFSDELWQEHRLRAQKDHPRHIDWHHPLRSLLHRN
jgi:hypothetical protein